MTGDARRKTRLGIGIAAIPVVLVALVLVVKLISMYALAQATIDAHGRDDAAGAVAPAEALQPLNLVERWKAPYDLGVAMADAGRLAEARTEFERALPLARGIASCPVRINLALVIERMGDEVRAQNPERARVLYEQALDVTADTPEACRDDEARAQSPDPSRDPGGILDDTAARLLEKLKDPPPEDGGSGEDDPSTQEPDGDALDEIERRLRDGQRARDELEDERQPGDGSRGEGKPW